MRFYNHRVTSGISTPKQTAKTHNSSDYFIYSSSHTWFNFIKRFIMFPDHKKLCFFVFNLFDRQTSSSVRLLATNVTDLILCLITLHNLRNTSIMININDNTTKSSTVMSLNKTLSTFFPPLQELANWLAVTLTLLWLMFVSIVFYSRLPAAETQIVDHATVKRQLIILGRKTGDDSGRRDGKQWWYMSEYDEDVMGETQTDRSAYLPK